MDPALVERIGRFLACQSRPYSVGMSVPRPPRRAVGHLDSRRREAILIKAETLPLNRAGATLSHVRMFGAWSEAEFLSDLSSALVETAERYGLGSDALVEQVRREARDLVAQGRYDDDVMSLHQTYATPDDKFRMALRDHGYRLALLALPEPEFLTAIEHTAARYAPRSQTARLSCETLVTYVDAAMRAHAVPFAANPDGQRFDGSETPCWTPRRSRRRFARWMTAG